MTENTRAIVPNKVCPVILRQGKSNIEILVFRHPLAGVQLVKGSIEPGEELGPAALRELAEESGITSGRVVKDLGIWVAGFQDQIWSFHEVRVDGDLPDAWLHYCADDTGRVFEFFWHPLNIAPSNEWHAVFRNALKFIVSHVH